MNPLPQLQPQTEVTQPTAARRSLRDRDASTVIASGLELSRAGATITEQHRSGMTEFVSHLKARVALGPESMARLFDLWNAALAIRADEISDWKLPDARATLSGDLSAPEVAACGATVYDTGEVSVSIQLAWIDPVLWLVDFVDLTQFEAG